MIYFTDNVIYVLPEESEVKDTSVPEESEGKDTSVPEETEGNDTSVPEETEGNDTTVPEETEGKDITVSEETKGKVSSVLDESSATGETQQSSTPTIINDFVCPDNSYSKYCFFFLMLLFALFVGRSFRKGV